MASIGIIVLGGKVTKIKVFGGIVAIVILGAAVFGYLTCRSDDVTSVAKDGYKNADVEKTSTFLGKVNPFKGPTKTDKLLEGWVPGTRIIEVEPQDETVYVVIPPTGPVQVPEETEGVTVHEKPIRDWGFEFRPFLGAGVSIPIAPAAVAGVDVFHIGRIHTGPALVVDSNSVSGAWTAAYGIWRNVEVRGGGGFGNKGGMVVVAVSIGIE